MLIRSSYVKLPVELKKDKKVLKNSKKGLINIKNNNKNIFFGVMLGMLTP